MGEREEALYKKEKKRDEGGGGLVGTVKEMKGGYVLKYNWVWEIWGERKRILG